LRRVQRSGQSARATIAARRILSDLKSGDSVAVSGACVTAVRVLGDSFTCDLSAETLSRTTLCLKRLPAPVNLERASLPTTRMGGHLVLGHVDGIGTVVSLVRSGDGLEMVFEMPDELRPYVVDKGSIAVDGVSLTPFAVAGRTFRVALIPTTLGETTLQHLSPGDPVNLEADVMAKYAVGARDDVPPQGPPSGVTAELLRRTGFLD